MLENRMVMVSEWRNLEREKMFGFENAVSQPEHAGIDYYGCEVLEGDEIAIDHDNCDEIILKEHLKTYCKEVLGFTFDRGWVFEKNGDFFRERWLEAILCEQYNFDFKVAE